VIQEKQSFNVGGNILKELMTVELNKRRKKMNVHKIKYNNLWDYSAEEIALIEQKKNINKEILTCRKLINSLVSINGFIENLECKITQEQYGIHRILDFIRFEHNRNSRNLDTLQQDLKMKQKIRKELI
jgi:hypothetical protein